MNERPTIREQMDACRPDSDDLHLPEHAADLAELTAGVRENGPVRAQFELSQQVDRVVRGAMQDVSLPAGLEARLLAAVQAESALIENPVVLAPAAANRRWFLKIAVGLTAAAALVLIGFFVPNPFKPTEQPITKDQLASQVQEWLLAAGPIVKSPPSKADLATFPIGTVLGPVTHSGSFTASQGKITAYRVTINSSVATLLAFPTTKTYPVGNVPIANLPSVSGGWQVRAWQSGGVLYVIAVSENSDVRLDQFIRPQPIG
jgi:hypothetical protein